MRVGDIIWGMLVLIALFLILRNPSASIGILTSSASAISQFIQDLQGRSKPR